MFCLPRQIQSVGKNGCCHCAAIISTPANQHHAQTRRVGFCPEHHFMRDRSDVNSIGCSFYACCLVFVDTLNVFLRFLSRFTLDLSAEGCWHFERNVNLNNYFHSECYQRRARERNSLYDMNRKVTLIRFYSARL